MIINHHHVNIVITANRCCSLLIEQISTYLGLNLEDEVNSITQISFCLSLFASLLSDSGKMFRSSL